MLFFQVVLTVFMLAVMVYDTSKFIIPNWLVGTMLLLWPAMLLMTTQTVDWKIALIVFGITFVIGYIIFILRVMGGGDVKLLAVCALWVGGMPQIAEFMVYMGVFGGFLALALLAVRPLMVYLPIKHPPRVLRKGEPVPYGIAIAIAFLIVLWEGVVPGVR